MEINASTPLEFGFSPRKTLRRLAPSVAFFAVAVAVLFLLSGTSRAEPCGQRQIGNQAKNAAILETILGETPSSFPQSIAFLTHAGAMTTYFPGGPVVTKGNPFFDTSITKNGRSCFTCHVPPGWTINPSQISTIFLATGGKSALFQPIDSAVCPDAPGATGPVGLAFIKARSQLFNRGNIRISINAPNPLAPAGTTTFEGNTPSGDNSSRATPQWILTVKKDPTGCEHDKTYGLPAGTLSVYRRTMPSANVAFLNPGARGPDLFNIMWDAREPSLESQFIDATEFHGQGSNPAIAHPSDPSEGALFQQGTFAAETYDFIAGDLTGKYGSGATGGPQNLFDGQLNVTPGGFFPPGSCFNNETLDGFPFCSGILGIPAVFSEYLTFATATGKYAAQIAQRESIARGEAIFNTRSFIINDVAGLDDVLNGSVGTNPPGGSNSTVTGTCSTCHNNQSVGNDNFLDPKRNGIMDNSNNTHNAMPPSPDFPLFAFYCPSGSIPFFSNPVTSSNCNLLPGNPSKCDEFDTTDPGEGLADGECEDLGKMKVPVLRGLAARAPYFHGGNAASLNDLVNFYNTRFSIGLSSQDKSDLVNFMNTL